MSAPVARSARIAVDPGPGRSHPLGSTIDSRGASFSVYAKHAAALELLLFDRPEDNRPARVVPLDPRRNRTYHYWHVDVPGVVPGQVYAYRARGPFEPSRRLRFDGDKVLLDPYGRALAVPPGYSRAAACAAGDNAATAMKSVVADLGAYDWEGDRPLRRPASRTVIYELHVGGFTRHPNSGVAPAKRGTYAGLIEKIPYLQELGVTAVELLPVFQFDPQDAAPGLVNYWGYSPVSFFAPHGGYGSTGDPLRLLDEFRDMVKALHRARIEVILDVVYNHTAEGGEGGPTLCYRGLANDDYYMLADGGRRYADYSGCGNTFNAGDAIVRRLVLDSLRYWVAEMHVDGFRFDLASILTRDENGAPLANPPLLWDIESDPVLGGSKLIAEAWDAAGLYQVGSFVGDSWMEWNGRFRDDVRRFLRGDRGTVSAFASRLLASPDLFGHEGREAEQSVSFVTCHDGFTLNDLVSYDRKHNEANGEDGRDGSNDNLSWNCGVEGPSDDPAVEALRNRQCKNFLAVNLLAMGTPMLLMGDEVRRTQGGNNNAYCQDDPTSWFDWSRLDRHADIRRFVTSHIVARRQRDVSLEDPQLPLSRLLAASRIAWHGVELDRPDWGQDSHSIALTATGLSGRFAVHLMFNAYWEPLEFAVPPVPEGAGTGWRRWLDTSLMGPDDIASWSDAVRVTDPKYPVGPRSIAALITRAEVYR
jgi:isoamylase